LITATLLAAKNSSKLKIY